MAKSTKQVGVETIEPEVATTSPPGTAVTTTETTTEVATISVSHEMLLEDSGSNGFAKDDISTPFVRVLQDGSPQVKKREPKYIEGAEAGMIFNTVTGRLWPESVSKGVIMIPVAYTPSYVEWKPNRGGFAKDHGADASIVLKTKKGGKDNKEDVLENGNIITRAGLYYVFIYDEETGDVTEVAFSMSGLGLTASRKWNTTIRGIRIPKDPKNPSKGTVEPAMFYMAYRVKTYLDSRDAGDSFQYEIKPYKPTAELGPLGPAIYLAARKFKALIAAGAVKVDHDKSVDQGGGSDDETPF